MPNFQNNFNLYTSIISNILNKFEDFIQSLLKPGESSVTHSQTTQNILKASTKIEISLSEGCRGPGVPIR